MNMYVCEFAQQKHFRRSNVKSFLKEHVYDKEIFRDGERNSQKLFSFVCIFHFIHTRRMKL